MDRRDALLEIYRLLNGYFGDLRWWPAESPFEVMVGAILTQNTAWRNVEIAIVALRKERLLSPAAFARIPEEALAEIIRPSGCYRVKAASLKAFVRFLLRDYAGEVSVMKEETLPRLREKLLGIRGIGPETADSILLYACEKPIFISDAYTRRILLRHGLVEEDAGYHGIQAMAMAALPNESRLFNQYHALMVAAAKTFCRTKPRCDGCPLAVLGPGREIR
jgi:endonuclease-3 related protein